MQVLPGHDILTRDEWTGNFLVEASAICTCNWFVELRACSDVEARRLLKLEIVNHINNVIYAHMKPK